MSAKIYISEGVQTFLKRWRGVVPNPSQVVNKAVARYNFILLHSLPDFTLHEWCAVFDLLAEYGHVPFNEIQGLPKSLSQQLIQNEGLVSKWNLKLDLLLKKLNNMDVAATVSVIDIAERYSTTHIFENVGVPVKSKILQ